MCTDDSALARYVTYSMYESTGWSRASHEYKLYAYPTLRLLQYTLWELYFLHPNLKLHEFSQEVKLITVMKNRLLRKGLYLLSLNKTHRFGAGDNVKLQADGEHELVAGAVKLSLSLKTRRKDQERDQIRSLGSRIRMGAATLPDCAENLL